VLGVDGRSGVNQEKGCKMAEKQKNPSFRSDTISTPNNPPWRCAWVQHLHTKRTKRAGGAEIKTPRFDFSLVIPKLGQPDTCPNYGMLVNLLAQAANKANWLQNGQWPQGIFWPIQDGDVPYTPKPPAPGQPAVQYDPTKYKWRERNWIIEVTNYFDSGPKVAILQSNGAVVDLPAQTHSGRTWYKSGDFVIASIHAYTFHNEKFGLNFGFDGVLFVGDGEAIGTSGGKSAQEMFAGVSAPVGIKPMGSSVSGPTPQYTPTPGGPPMPPGSVPGAPVYVAPGPVAPAPVLPPMPPGVVAPPPLPAFPPR
jgi:Protein of unknown function (DUF2815)